MDSKYVATLERPSPNRDAGCDTDLRRVVERAMRIVEECVTHGCDDFSALNEVDECVYIKNADRVIVFSNDAHRRHFTPGSSPIGRMASSYLDPMMAARGDKLESLLLDGCSFVECEHAGPCPDGGVYRVFAHKQSLKALGAPGLAILGVLRLVRIGEGAANSSQLDLPTAASRFRDLSPRDQEMCRLTALGVSSRELGERLGMTTRGIELRKQKSFAKLGVAKAVDLARLLTRLQDGGHLDLGL